MKLVLKILALPVLFVVKVICILGNLLTNVVSYVIGLLLLVIGGSAIYCIVKALWQSLLILSDKSCGWIVRVSTPSMRTAPDISPS